jgi:hypothetical protein
VRRIGVAAVTTGVLLSFASFVAYVSDASINPEVSSAGFDVAGLFGAVGFALLLLAPPSARSQGALLAQMGLALATVAFLIVALIKVYRPSHHGGFASSLQGEFDAVAWRNEGVRFMSAVFVLAAIARPFASRVPRIVVVLLGLFTMATAAYATYLVAVVASDNHGFRSFQGEVWFGVAGVPVTLVSSWALARFRASPRSDDGAATPADPEESPMALTDPRKSPL